jgi:hypothetical protein
MQIAPHPQLPTGPTDTRVLLALRDPEAFPILLAHHSHAWHAATAAQLTLTLSNHTHGGQLTRIFCSPSEMRPKDSYFPGSRARCGGPLQTDLKLAPTRNPRIVSERTGTHPLEDLRSSMTIIVVIVPIIVVSV